MPETETIEQSLPEVLMLPTRGACAVQYYELYDEVAHGADNLYIRGRFSTIAEVADYVNQILQSGNPCDISAGSNNYALGRYQRYQAHNTLLEKDPADPFPQKAYYAYRIMLRIKFYNDFAYIEFGKKWNPLRLPDGSINPNYPIEPAKRSNGYRFAMNDEDFKIVRSCMIDSKDSIYIRELLIGGGSQLQAMSLDDEELSEKQRNAVEDSVLRQGGSVSDSIMSNFSVMEGGAGVSELGVERAQRDSDPEKENVWFEGYEEDEKIVAYTLTDENGAVLFSTPIDNVNPDETHVYEPGTSPQG